MIPNINIIRLFYKAMLTGIPVTLFNPYSDTSLLAPCTVYNGSTYINYRLDDKQKDILQNYIGNDLKLIPTTLSYSEPISDRPYYLSINIYNCTSPLFKFVSDEPVTRCEINTYVKNKNNETGTVIIDYTSNKPSIDPVELFQQSSFIDFKEHSNLKSDNILSYGNTYGNNINLSFSYIKSKFDKLFNMDPNLIRLTDNIFYKNGIIDKLYYDKSLVYSDKSIPKLLYIHFSFLNMTFDTPDSIFYFNNNVDFVGSIWHNLNTI
tara:strand:- start:349 stop:1140 length:792 start_codon:yes stop_codon:yes gene_type:complete